MTDARTLLRDAAYVAVGAGILAFQQAQVRRRELEQHLAPVAEVAVATAREAIAHARKALHPEA